MWNCSRHLQVCFPFALFVPLSEPQGIGWETILPLEKAYRCLQDRNAVLTKLLQLSKEDTVAQGNAIHEAILLSELFDEAWLSELTLRHLVDEKAAALRVSETKLQEQAEAIAKLHEEESQLMVERKKYGVDMGLETQAILKYKSKFEDVSHHLNTFSTGLQFMSATSVPSEDAFVVPLAEQMRCSFNELRRVNASLEEKLVITGVSKQKTMKELKHVLTEIRASCSRNPAKFRLLNEDALGDPNLSSHTLRDINSVWKATQPAVPSLTGEQTHTDMVTWLSLSMGHFTEECVNDIADVAFTRQRKNPASSASHLDEEAKLVGVLSAETHRYRSISGALKAAITDSQLLLDNNKFDSVGEVISNACHVMKKRIGCRIVTFWRKSNDGSEAIGFSSGHHLADVRVRTNPTDLALFERSGKETCSVDSMDLAHLPSLPSDIRSLVPLIERKGDNEKFEAFSVTSTSGGMTIVRGDEDAPFHSFSGIYCEQFYRRIVSAITPLQMIQVKRISQQRPLDLVECMFELRAGANSPSVMFALVQQHMHKLFRAVNMNVFLTLDSDSSQLIRIGKPDIVVDNDNVLEYCDVSGIPDKYNERVLAGVSVIATPSTLTEIVKANLAVALPPSASPSDLISSGYIDGNQVTHIRPVTRGRTVVLILCWTNPSPLEPSEGFDNNRVLTETFFNPESTSHKSVLGTYVLLLQSVLGAWFGGASSSLSGGIDLTSYQVEQESEQLLIRNLVGAGKYVHISSLLSLSYLAQLSVPE